MGTKKLCAVASKKTEMTSESRCQMNVLKTASELDEAFMAAAEGESAAWERLADSLAAGGADSFADPEHAAAWSAGAELLVETMAELPPAPVQGRLLRALAGAGYDTPRFRDALAAWFRQNFAHYSDPAGMLTALGILNPAVPPAQIARRWDAFAILSEGIECRHDVHGLGIIEEIDALGNAVRIRFDRPRSFSLDIALASLVFVQPGSLLDQLRREEIPWPAQLPPERLRDQLFACLVPVINDDDAVKPLLVPAVITETEFDALIAGLPEGSPTLAGGDNEESLQRAVAEARTLEELAQLLRHASELNFTPEDSTNVEMLLAPAAKRADLATVFASCTADLWRLAPAAPWLSQLLSECREALCWSTDTRFAELTDTMPGKLIGPWFEATLGAVGTERAGRLVVALPLRYWAAATRVLRVDDPRLQGLRDTIVGQAKTGELNADALVWLWENEGFEKELLRDTTLLFRTLARPVKGSYLKAAKELRKLLLQDSTFQAFLLNDGDMAAAAALLRAIEHQPVLGQDEKQSLLVRLVRIRPELRAEIEKRAAPARRKGVGRLTSMRSYEKRRQELQDIIQTRIPANSRAIAHARSYGDLRENAEYKAAKEEQSLLNAKRNELEVELDRVKAFDFSTVGDVDKVIPGSAVILRRSDQSEVTYYVLGLWDSAPDQNMISYDTPFGKSLLGKQVGDHITLPDGGEALVADVCPLPADMIRWLNHE
jgi:transcription elongation GreA/GreB family factor